MPDGRGAPGRREHRTGVRVPRAGPGCHARSEPPGTRVGSGPGSASTIPIRRLGPEVAASDEPRDETGERRLAHTEAPTDGCRREALVLDRQPHHQQLVRRQPEFDDVILDRMGEPVAGEGQGGEERWHVLSFVASYGGGGGKRPTDPPNPSISGSSLRTTAHPWVTWTRPEARLERRSEPSPRISARDATKSAHRVGVNGRRRSPGARTGGRGRVAGSRRDEAPAPPRDTRARRP